MMRFWLPVLGANYVLALLFVTRVLRRRKDPVTMVAWIFAILTIPVLGMLAYWVLASNRLRRKAGRRRRRVAHLMAEAKRWTKHHALPADKAGETHLPDDLAGIERLGRRLAEMPATGHNDVQILQEANATYTALEDALRAARDHIHMEYYIWQPDETGRSFRDLVIERARDGIRCRLLLDAVGCRRLGRKFLRPLVDAGVQVAFFMPLHLFPLRKRWSLHLRNHRKLAVIDGRVAFLGSQNIGDEYRGRLKRLSPWYDTHLRLSGPAALFIQQTFAEDWYLAARERLDDEAYFPKPERSGRSILQILPTGPDQSVSTLAQILFAAVSSATSSIRIATPYFVPDAAVRMALRHACYRGVQVRLVLPTRSDSALALWAARSFYAELVDAGVEIHEYDAGVLHSKLVTVDDRWCLLGSANMDVRSFQLNFEITALIYDQSVASELARSIDKFCGEARRITPRAVHRQPLGRQIGEGAARLLAPLL
ncbi:MAG: cardiolipin synthase [Phycisphaerae bacterium]|nr:cardiolipin synthase [Phycisphaerae bacterium]